MLIRKTIFIIITALIVHNADARQYKPVSAAMNNVKLELSTDPEGRVLYSVFFKGKTVIKPSMLGFGLSNDSALVKGFEILSINKRSADENWQPVWGEVKSIRNHYEELTIRLKQRAAGNRLLNIIFRVFSDGIGFRYEFPRQQNLRYFTIAEEFTEFNLTGNHKAFWIPGDYDTNEYAYTTSALSEIDAWKVSATATDIAVRTVPDQFAVQTPLMLKTADGLYINIHEAALVNYPAMQLHVDRASCKLSAALVPDATGNKAYLHTPFSTPWRSIIISDKAADVLSSKLILNLNEPSRIENTSWIRPMKFVGVWWEMQTGKSTWSYAAAPDTLDARGALIPSGKHGANTPNVRKYIDFASRNGIDGVLVEGWNTGWEDWFGNWKEEVFDFVSPYPDFDIGGICDYAAAKGVKMIMHNETSGSATNYEWHIDSAFGLMNKYNYPAVKTGYVGKIIPRGEYHDGQWMVNHYLRVAKKAAGHHVMLDAHEPVRPTGLHRTYPNWLASESARGNEYNAFSDGNQPEHETILPFTRLIGGPMDYTPGIFKLKGYSEVAGRQVHTTLSKQLALYVTIYSPLQMAADLPENYEKHMDAFQFIKDVALDWDDTRVLQAEPGDYITIARKEKGTGKWFIGAITDENKRTSAILLDFLDKGKKYNATIYSDAPDADWKDNPEAYKIEKRIVTAATTIKISLAPGGGAAVSIFPVPEK